MKLIPFFYILLYLDLQACKKLAHSEVKAFDDYMCTSVNMKKCISYIIVNEKKLHCTTYKSTRFIHLYHALYILCIYWLK